MLTKEENELLCRVGPGTPMGELMRQYWMPVTYDWELEPDGQPQRVRVLGEDLLAWRDTDGRPSFSARRTAPTVAPASTSAETRRAVSAAPTTAGSLTSKATASTCPMSPLPATSGTR